MSLHDDAKNNVIDHACTWRQLQRERIASPKGQAKEQARKAEYFAEKKLGQAVDALVNLPGHR